MRIWTPRPGAYFSVALKKWLKGLSSAEFRNLAARLDERREGVDEDAADEPLSLHLGPVLRGLAFSLQSTYRSAIPGFDAPEELDGLLTYYVGVDGALLFLTRWSGLEPTPEELEETERALAKAQLAGDSVENV